jgi:glucose-6-phosphate isomerase
LGFVANLADRPLDYYFDKAYKSKSSRKMMYNTHVLLKNNVLEFRGMPEVKPTFRLLKDMKTLFQDASIDDEDEVLYAMYRNVILPEHAQLFASMNLRHDITVIPVKFVGMEYVKTAGHFHPGGFPEIYQVLEGECRFLLQSDDDFVVVRAKQGDVIVIPGKYGHVMTNPHGKVLVTSNIVSDAFKSDYSLYQRLRGAAYYDTTGTFVPNPNYPEVPELRFAKPNGAAFGPSIYDAFVQNPGKFAFLTDPGQKEFLDL